MKISEAMREGFAKYPQTRVEFVRRDGENICVCALGAVYMTVLPESLQGEFIKLRDLSNEMTIYVNNALGVSLRTIVVSLPEDIKKELREAGFYETYEDIEKVDLDVLIVAMNDELEWEPERIVSVVERLGY